MEDTEPYPEVLIERLQADFDPDGTLHENSSIEVRANYAEVDELKFIPGQIDDEEEREELAKRYEPGETIDTDYLNGAYARLRFDVEDGRARLTAFKDATPSDANWIDVGFLRVVHGAAAAVETVPGVESVESVTATLNDHIQDGKDPEVRRA